MKEVNQIRIFVSCPGDITDELGSIKLIVEEFNKTIGRHNSYVLELLNWKTDTYTQIGVDAQEVINDQIDPRYDILVGIIWLKLGTPTKRDKSGTVEEINRALSNPEKEQLIYFKTTPPTDITSIDPEELTKINQYKKELGVKGVLYQEFATTQSFESQFRINLANLISDKIINKETKIQPTQIIVPIDNVDKYAHITSLIEEVENGDNESLELDIFNATDEARTYLLLVTTCLYSLTDTMNAWTATLNKRTKEINAINNIRDERLRMNKQKAIINLLADELLDFKNSIQNELPIFSENFRKVGTTYSKVILIAKKFKNSGVNELQGSATELRDTSESSLNSLALLLRAIMELPPLNFKFNKAKRETEITLKDLTFETMEGIKLLNEALKA